MLRSWREIELAAAQFAKAWADARYEKGETQTFYNEFFELFDISRRRVARYEEHVRLRNLASGFIDLLWPGVLIVEQKSRGRDLERAARQVGDYFDALSDDDKPRYQLVCDFQTFELTDRDTRKQVTFELANLHENVRFFAFMLGKQSPRVRAKEHLNEEAAQLIDKLYTDLIDTGYSADNLESFLTRIVFCLFADNAGIFQPRGILIDLIESRSSKDGRDLGSLLTHLFQILDTPLDHRQRGLDLELAGFPYIDGGLFAERTGIPSLTAQMRGSLLAACQFDWSEVSPAIFGALFQSILSKQERRDTGAFATSEENILKVIEDLFLRDLREELHRILQPGSRRREALLAFQRKLRAIRVLDPACGCGNFLVIAYRELRGLELELLKVLSPLGNTTPSLPTVNVDQFYGIEKHGYSVRIAEAALWMTDHIANNQASIELDVDFLRVPLEVSPKIAQQDALASDWRSVFAPGEHTFIIGNPPYKGPKMQQDSERAQVVDITGLGSLDYAAAWIVKASEFASSGTRIGLVTVNSLAEGEQVGRLFPLLYSRYEVEIAFAHQSFKWQSEGTGGANVQVVVLGLMHRSRVPERKRLYKYATADGPPVLQECQVISPYLIEGNDLTDPHVVVQEVSEPINSLPPFRTGTKPMDGGYYVLSPEERDELLRNEPDAARVLRPYVGTTEFLKGTVRYLLVLSSASARDIKAMPLVAGRVRNVKAWRSGEGRDRRGKLRKRLQRPDQLASTPTTFHITSIPTRPFLVVPEVTSERRRYVPIGWLEPPVIPSNLVKYAEGVTLAQFAMLTSAMQMAWLRIVGGRLEGRYRWSLEVVYNTFPLPEKYDSARLEELARQVLSARDAALQRGDTLEDMYDPDLMPDVLKRAHLRLDDEVDKQYLGHPAVDDHERIVALLNLYGNRLARH